MTSRDLAVLQLIGAGIGVAVAFRVVSGKSLRELEQFACLLSVYLVLAPIAMGADGRR